MFEDRRHREQRVVGQVQLSQVLQHCDFLRQHADLVVLQQQRFEALKLPDIWDVGLRFRV